MKRSKCITLTLLTGATLVVTGCKEEKPSFYKDSSACMEELKDSAACQEAEKAALAEHEKTAPKFTSKEECEQKFGAENCVQPPDTQRGATASPSGGGFFMPMMMGYMMGRMGGGGGLFGGGNRWATQPLYRDRNGNAYAGGNRGGMAGLFRGNRFEPSPSYAGNWSKSTAPAVRRGGFGGSSFFAGS